MDYLRARSPLSILLNPAQPVLSLPPPSLPLPLSFTDWLPALEKFGKTFQLLLTPDDLYLLQTGLDTGGPFVAARWATGAAWVGRSLRLSSRHADCIAFRLEGPALRRGLRGALALGADALELRLTQRAAEAGAAGGADYYAPPTSPPPPPQPFLALAARVGTATLAHDVPTSRPYSPSELDALVSARDAAPLCAFYLDCAGVAPRLVAALDRLSTLAGGDVCLEAGPSGRLALRARGVGVAAGLALAGLPVLPPTARVVEEEGGNAPRGLSAAAALPPPGVAPPVPGTLLATARARDLERALAAAASLRPARALLGIGPPEAPFIHVMLAFRASCSSAGGGGEGGGGGIVDEGLDLVIRVPVVEEEEG